MFTMPPSAAARKAAARATFLILPPLSLNCRARRSKSTLLAKDIPVGPDAGPDATSVGLIREREVDRER